MRACWLCACCILGVAVFFCCAAPAQPVSPEEDQSSGSEAGSPAEAAGIPETAENAAAPALESDVIVLKNGKQLVGFQVIRQTTRDVVVRLMDGVEMTIPMRQVQAIQLDDISGSQSDSGSGTAKPEHELIPGVKLAPVMYEKLQRSVADEPLSFKNEDAIQNVLRLSQQVEVPFEIDAALGKLPAEQRRWTIEIPAGTKFLSVVNDYLLKQFPDLDITYKSDRLILSTNKELPASGPAESPAP